MGHYLREVEESSWLRALRALDLIDSTTVARTDIYNIDDVSIDSGRCNLFSVISDNSILSVRKLGKQPAFLLHLLQYIRLRLYTQNKIFFWPVASKRIRSD